MPYREDLLKSVSTFLERWNGHKARIWAYQAAHSALTIRITSQKRPGENLHIFCLGPIYMRGPFVWDGCNFRVVPDVQLEDGSFGYSLQDEAAGFEVRTEQLEVGENCKPLR